MKKIILLTVLCFSTQFFVSSVKAATVQNPVIVKITDTTLDNIYYHQTSFTVPTKLVFTNLTSVKGYVYFYQNTNLVGVEFPLLTQTGDYFSVNGNQNLKSVKAPMLNTIYNYLYVEGNTKLTELKVCGLKNILPDTKNLNPQKPYYNISNNSSVVDATPHCFSLGGPKKLTLSNKNISENLKENSLIGILSADSYYSKGKLNYYLVDMNNPDFKIVGNKLLANHTFDYEAKNQYTVSVGVFNQLGESITKNFVIKIADVIEKNIKIVEITDTTLDNIYYHQTSFTVPTKLVFTNLTSVKGYIYFEQNTNLVGVEFPLLTQTGDYFYVNGNQNLKSVKAPMLNTIYNNLYVSGNTELTELNVCGLKNILPIDNTLISYYYIINNPLLDMTTTCLTNTTISFTPAKPILILPAPNTLIGTFSSDTTDPVSYYFVNEQGNKIDNPNFIIEDDKLYLKNEYSSYDASDFNVNIGGVKTSSNSIAYNKSSAKATTKNSTSLNEKIQLSISFNIKNTNLTVKPFNTNENKIIIYPNPAANVFEIQTQETIKEFQLFDMLGRQLKNLKIENNKVDTSNIPKGHYLVVIKTESNILKQKLIIK